MTKHDPRYNDSHRRTSQNPSTSRYYMDEDEMTRKRNHAQKMQRKKKKQQRNLIVVLVLLLLSVALLIGAFLYLRSRQNQSGSSASQSSGPIKTMTAEIKKYPELEQTIIDYLEIPAEDQAQTQYVYNYVDLNDDGKDEIFALVEGPYTSGSGGSTALHILVNDGKLTVNQKFTLVNAPVIISDHKTGGIKDLVLSSDNGYMILASSEGEYPASSSGTAVSSLDGISGTSILNDSGKALYLGDVSSTTQDTAAASGETLVSVKIGNEVADASIMLEDDGFNLTYQGNPLSISYIPYQGSTFQKSAGENSYTVTITTDGQTITLTGVYQETIDLLSSYVSWQ